MRSSSETNIGGIKRPLEDAPGDWRIPKLPWRSSVRSSTESIATSNRFSTLEGDNGGPGAAASTQDAPSGKKRFRIPPVIVDLGPALSHKTIQDMVMKYTTNFHLQYRGKNKVAIHCYSESCHQRVKEGFRKDNVSYHTFTRKDEKMAKAVIRGLPILEAEDIVEDLASLGFKDCKVVVFKPKVASITPSNPLYLIQIPAGTDMTKFGRIKFLCKCVVEVRKYKPKNWEGTQCFRCQGFGHASSNCNHPPRCVKCLESHSSQDCPKKDRSTPAQCCNCKEYHPANFRQCLARQTYLDRIRPQRTSLPGMTPTTNENKSIKASTARTWAPAEPNAKKTSFADNPLPINVPTNLRNPVLAHNSKETQQPGQGRLDACTSEMLHIFNIIKSLKQEFLACKTMLDKVILILNHLGQYV